MSKLDAAVSEAARSFAEEARRDLGDHPSVTTLLAFDAGTLPAEQVEPLRAHLALCPECTRSMLDRNTLPAEDEIPEEHWLSDEEDEALWAGLQRRLAAEGQERPGSAPTGAGLGRSGPAWLAVAAALVAVAGLSFWVMQLRQQVGELSGPRTKVFSVHLNPEGAAVRSGPVVPEISVPAEPDDLAFVVSWPELRDPQDDLLLEVRREDDAGPRVVGRTEVILSAERKVIVVIPWRQLGVGTYWFGLWEGQSPEDRRLLGTYRVRLVREG